MENKLKALGLNPTELGLKQYSEANGDFTVTHADWTSEDAVAVPYKMIGGEWRLKFNIKGTWDSASSTNTAPLAISGITTPTFRQSMSVYENGVVGRTSDQFSQGLVLENSNSFNINWSSSLDHSDGISIAGDIMLAEKPTWAD